MASPASTVSVVMIILACAIAQTFAQEVPEGEVKTAVRADWDAYIDAFVAGRTDVVANDVYAAPSFQLGSGGTNVRMTATETQASFDATHRSLRLEQYDRSETDRAEICVINDGAALLSARYTRYRTDGSVLMTGASAYLFGRFGNAWRIVATMGNPAAKMIVCG